MSQATTVREALASASKITPIVGTFVGYESGKLIVDVGGGRIPVEPAGGIIPQINEDCWVWFINTTPFLMGPSIPKPGYGTVTAVSGDWVTVSTAVGSETLPFFAGYSPMVGDIVKIDWSELPAVAWVLSTQPDPVTPPPAPGVPSGEHVQVFTAVDAGSQNSSGGSWWQAQVWASNTTRGMWFYGTKLPDTIPSGAVILSVEIYVSLAQKFGANPNFATHVYAGKPGGVAGFSSGNTPTAVANGWIGLPVSFGNSLKAGGGSRGVGCNQGGFNKFSSLAADPQSGALRIRYRT